MQCPQRLFILLAFFVLLFILMICLFFRLPSASKNRLSFRNLLGHFSDLERYLLIKDGSSASTRNKRKYTNLREIGSEHTTTDLDLKRNISEFTDVVTVLDKFDSKENLSWSIKPDPSFHSSKQLVKYDSYTNTSLKLDEMSEGTSGVLQVSNNTDEKRLPKISEPQHYLICRKPNGRLGNIMFLFAASLGIARTLQYKYVINSSHALLKYFDIKQVTTINIENVKDLYKHQWDSKKRRERMEYRSKNLTVAGYFHSWKYFQNYSDEIRNAFTIRKQYMELAFTFLKDKTPEDKTLIGIHVRRGDFLRTCNKTRESSC